MNNDLLAGSIPTVSVRCPADEFENMIRKFGIGFCCEWFGHPYDGEFAIETARILSERSEEA